MQKMKSGDNLNKHITENLLYYLSLDKPEYAILLSGRWGSGKTFFIDKFIKKNDESKSIEIQEKKFIKISLFGLKDTRAIDEQIFQNIHPILGHKYTKLTGNILRGAFRLGINLDFDGDGKKDGNLATNLDKFNLLDLFSKKPKESKKNEEIIFVFDDLERTEINIREILGYINYFVEQASFKVILIANEDKLIEENKDVYLEFKEKVIGKTFEVRHYFPDVLNKFLDDNPIEIDGFDKSIIENVYSLARYDNLRHIRQSIIDFIYITKKINNKYLKNIEFLSKFTYVFFFLSIEAKSGSLDEDGFTSYNHLLDSNESEEHKSPINELFKKYNFKSDFLLPRSSWIKLLYKSYIEPEELDTTLDKLSFFVEDREKEKPSWVKLWSYRDLEDEEFENLLKDVTEKFKLCSYETPELLLHAVAMLIYFNKEELSEYSIKAIKDQLEICLSSKYSQSEHWKKKLLNNDRMFNGTGLSYMDDRDTDFLESFELVKNANVEIYNENKDEEEKILLDKFIESIKSGDLDYIREVLLSQDNAYSPVLSKLSTDNFFKAIIECSNKNMFGLSRVMSSRYSDNTLNGRGYEFYLQEELQFWQDLKSKFKSFDFSQFKVKKIILKQFEEYIIDKILDRMNNKQDK